MFEQSGEAQRRLGVENACDMARRFLAAGFEVVVADVLSPDTGELYRALLPSCMVVHLVANPAVVQDLAAGRPLWLTQAEFDVLHDADRANPPSVDSRLDVSAMSPQEQVDAVGRLWRDGLDEVEPAWLQPQR